MTHTPQVKLASKRFLAGSLGLAAGVMLYVSLVEIFVKSQGAFANHGYSEVRESLGAYVYMECCFSWAFWFRLFFLFFFAITFISSVQRAPCHAGHLVGKI